MRLVSLNTWGATQGQEFFGYVAELAPKTGIFCFQEIFSAEFGAPKIHNGWHMFLLDELKALLPDFTPYYEAKSLGYADDTEVQARWPVSHGLGIFVSKKLPVESYSAATVADALLTRAPKVEGLVKVQSLGLLLNGKLTHIVNIHGMSRPGNKLDTPARIEQSENIVGLLKNLNGPKILCGDFNLMPNTQSIALLEQAGLQNLIKKFNITNTRNKISWEQYHNKQMFADYIFVSPEVRVKDFQVPYNEVSDHLPMILDFEI